jgi:hypothetical protein
LEGKEKEFKLALALIRLERCSFEKVAQFLPLLHTLPY